jgi:hypothetical protein
MLVGDCFLLSFNSLLAHRSLQSQSQLQWVWRSPFMAVKKIQCSGCTYSNDEAPTRPHAQTGKVLEQLPVSPFASFALAAAPSFHFASQPFVLL